MVDLARQWGLMTRVLVVVGPEEPGSDELIERVDAAGRALEGLDGIETVTWKVDAASAREAAQRVMDAGMRLYRPGLDPLSVDDAAKRLAALKERLASPEAMVIQDYLLADPLGFGRGSLQGLEAMGAAMGTTTERGAPPVRRLQVRHRHRGAELRSHGRGSLRPVRR